MANPYSEASRVFGERVRNARTALGLSQVDVWQISGVHFTNVGKIERGEANPALHTIIRLADALNIDPAQLVVGFTANDLSVKERGQILPVSARGTMTKRSKK